MSEIKVAATKATKATTTVSTTTVSTTKVVVDLTGTDVQKWTDQLAQAREAIKAFETMENEAKEALQTLMGAADFGAVDGINVVQTMNGKSTGIDRAILKEAFPDAYVATYWEKPTRWFKVLSK